MEQLGSLAIILEAKMAENEIVTLEAKEGNRFAENGECIATHGRQIVFLPKGVKPGQDVRVELHEIRPDSRGRMMYRGQPAPPLVGERWIDNGDGSATCVETSTDWLGKTSEGGATQTRPLEVSETAPKQAVETVIVWGSSVETTYLLREQVATYPEQREKVVGGKIALELTGRSRVERSGTIERAVCKVEAQGIYNEAWRRDRLKAVILPEASIYLHLTFIREGDTDTHTETVNWGTLPDWLQDELLAAYPVCKCGRARYDTANPDGYAKCEQCRQEEACHRCGQQAKVTNLGGRLICDSCQPMEKQEQLIERLVPVSRRQSLAALAQKLLGAQYLPREAGEAIMQATLDHIDNRWDRDAHAQRMSGYAHYYLANDGFYGTKFDSAALTILSALPQARGDGLVTLVAWLAGKKKVEECESYGDFYHCTQVKGESHKPALSESGLERLKVADKVRGNEADRQTLLQLREQWQRVYGRDEQELAQIVKAGLASNDQDYGAALALLGEKKAERSGRRQREQRGEIWLNVEIEISTQSRTRTDAFVVAEDGSIVEPTKKEMTDPGRKGRVRAYVYGDLPREMLVLRHTSDNYGYRYSEHWKVQHLPRDLTTAQQETVARLEEETRQHFRGKGTGWDLTREGTVSFTTAYSRDFSGRERTANDDLCQSFPIDVSEWTSAVEDNRVVCGPYRRHGNQPEPKPEPPVEPQAPLTADELDAATEKLRNRFGRKERR